MKKNIIIIALIFIVPIIAYLILSNTKTTTAVAKSTTGNQPQVIKFSSKLCSDCQKLKKEFEHLTPKYEKQIVIVEYDVQLNDEKVKSAVDKYNIDLVPTIVYIDKNGKEVRRTEGYVEKKKLEEYFNELLK